MQRITLFLICFLCLPLFGFAGIPGGKVIEGLTMKSRVLGHDVNYAIYLPPDYESSNRNYPVVYLLHGYTDNESAWIQFGEVHLSADKGIANGNIASMIIVMPDAGLSFYVDNASGKSNYETMFVTEFIPFIESSYRIRKAKEFRAIAGLSMGGYGSLLYSLKHPGLFAACAAFSSAIFTDEEILSMPPERFNFRELFSTDAEGNRLNAHWRQNSILDLVKTLPEEQLKSTRYYLDCGDKDFLYKGNAMLWVELTNRGIPHEFRVREGMHNWTYWRTGITGGLEYISQSFQR